MQLFDIVVCQAEKVVTCGNTADTGGTQVSTAQTCRTEKLVTCEATCPGLNEDEAAAVWGTGGVCTCLNSVMFCAMFSNECVAIRKHAFA